MTNEFGLVVVLDFFLMSIVQTIVASIQNQFWCHYSAACSLYP